MRKKHSETSSPLLLSNPLSRTHRMDSESSQTPTKSIAVNERIPVDSVERDETSEIDSAISESKSIDGEAGSYYDQVADNGQKTKDVHRENESIDKKRKRGRPKKKVDLDVHKENESIDKKRKRGRPKKKVDLDVHKENESIDKKGKRGRPKKKVDLEVSPNSRSAAVSEKIGRGRPKGKTRMNKVQESDDEDMEISKTRGAPKRAATQRNKILEFGQQGSESESESESKSDSDSSIEKKRLGRPKKKQKPPATTNKKRSSSRSRLTRKVIHKLDVESEISTDSNSVSSESELERELQRESEKDSESEPEIQLERLPKPNTSAEGGSKRGRGRPKGQKNRAYPISEEIYEVEQILGEKIEGGCHYFLVKWKNWPENANSWERAANVTCDELIENFRCVCRSMHSNRRTSDSTSTETPIIVTTTESNI